MSGGPAEIHTEGAIPDDPLAELDRLAVLAGAVDARIPPRYRRDAFRVMAERAVGPKDRRDRHGMGAQEPAGQPPQAPSAAADPALPLDGLQAAMAAGEARHYLTAHAPLLGHPGRTLLKALLALRVAVDQMGVEWLTPAEMERLLLDHGGASGIYRTNLSNALRVARGRVDRRPRGRGFEYRITTSGREILAAELRRLSL